MKIVTTKMLSLMLLIGASAFAAPTGPPPPGVPPPGLPVDGGVLVLSIVAMLFGLYKIYRLQQKQKTPM